MIFDKHLELAEDQAITVTAVSESTIDRGHPINDNEFKSSPFMVLFSKIAFASAGASTLTVTIETAVDAAFTSPIVVYTSAAIPKAKLTANTEVLKFAFPAGTKRYIRANFTVGTGPFTAGTLDLKTAADV